MTENRLTEEEQEKIEWVDKLVEHHLKQTGGFQTCLRRGLKKFGETWREDVKRRNARLRREGLL